MRPVLGLLRAAWIGAVIAPFVAVGAPLASLVLSGATDAGGVVLVMLLPLVVTAPLLGLLGAAVGTCWWCARHPAQIQAVCPAAARTPLPRWAWKVVALPTAPLIGWTVMAASVPLLQRTLSIGIVGSLLGAGLVGIGTALSWAALVRALAHPRGA